MSEKKQSSAPDIFTGEWLSNFKERTHLDNKWKKSAPIVTTLTSDDRPVTAMYLDKSNILYTTSEGGNAQQWNLDGCGSTSSSSPDLYQQHHKQTQQVFERTSFRGHGGPIWCVDLLSPEILLTGSSDKTIKAWETGSGKEIKTFRGHTEWVSSLTHKPCDLDRFFSGGWDGKIRMWQTDLENPIKGQTEHLFTTGNDNAVYSLEYSTSRDQVISGNRDGTCQIFDVETKKKVGDFTNHTKIVNCVYVDKDLLISGSKDTKVVFTDLRSEEQVLTFSGNTSNVLSLDYDPDNKRLVTGSNDKLVKLWDVRMPTEQERTFAEHKSSVFAVKLDYFKIISGSSDGSIKILSQ